MSSHCSIYTPAVRVRSIIEGLWFSVPYQVYSRLFAMRRSKSLISLTMLKIDLYKWKLFRSLYIHLESTLLILLDRCPNRSEEVRCNFHPRGPDKHCALTFHVIFVAMGPLQVVIFNAVLHQQISFIVTIRYFSNFYVRVSVTLRPLSPAVKCLGRGVRGPASFRLLNRDSRTAPHPTPHRPRDSTDSTVYAMPPTPLHSPSATRKTSQAAQQNTMNRRPRNKEDPDDLATKPLLSTMPGLMVLMKINTLGQ
jgi:hypothetical protein